MKSETFKAAWWNRFFRKPKKGSNKKEKEQQMQKKKEGAIAAKKEKEQQGRKEGRRDEEEQQGRNEGRRDGGEVVDAVERSSPGNANAECEFKQELLYEGISLTPTGRNIAGQIAKAYLPKYPKCYRKALMGFFGGDKCQEGIFWVKVTDAQHKAEMRAKAKNMNCDAVETKGAEGLNVNNINMASEFIHRDLGTKVRSVF